MTTNRKPISKESIKKLHKRFMNLVNIMAMNNVELPDEFELHYVISEHSDRQGKMVSINPFLNRDKATNYYNKVFENTGIDSEGKYGWYRKYHTIVNSSGRVALENYHTDNEDNKHKIDYQIQSLY